MQRKIGRGHALGGGVVAGIIGGVILSLVMLVGALTKHQDIWMGMKGASAPFLHARAMQPGFDAAAVGLGVAVHFAIAIIWGVLFAAIFYGLSSSGTIAAGVLWGGVVWLTMFYLVLPLAGLSQVAHGEPVSAAIVTHVIFGLGVALGFLPFQHVRPHAPPIAGAPIST